MSSSSIEIISKPNVCKLSRAFTVRRSKAKLESLLNNAVTAAIKSGNPIIQFINISRIAKRAFPVSIDLALIAATRMGNKTLYIDTSDSGVIIKKLIKSDVQAYQILSIENTNLHLLSLPGHYNDKTLDEGNIQEIFETLKSKYDLVIVNSDSLLRHPEGLNFSAKSDGVILVLEAEKTRAPVAKEVKKKLEMKKVHIIGTVLNNRKSYIPGFLYALLFKS